MAQSRLFIAAATLIAASLTHSEGWVSLEQDEAQTNPTSNNAVPVQVAQTTPQQNLSTSVQPATPNSGAVQLMYEELDVLRQEVQTLRGVVEEQAHEIRKLKTEQKERYIELDRRMSQVLQGGAAASVGAAPINAQGEQAQYETAFKLIKAKKLPEGLVALQAFLTQYPQSKLAVNAYYWTGQIFYIQGQLDEARKAFLVVINQYPEHQKTADSKLKLGKVYHQLGEESKAKEMLRTVIDDYAQSSPGTARLAENYLSQNF